MSRIGKLPINIPAGVTVTTKDNVVTVKGPKGELTQKIDPSIIVKVEDNEMTFSIDEKNDTVDTKQKQAFHGLYRALVNSMVVGVTEGFEKKLEVNGVGTCRCGLSCFQRRQCDGILTWLHSSHFPSASA